VRLPNFLIIGSGRSGTTSLYEYMRRHPDVFMSDVKEPSYFAYMDGGLPSRGRHAEWVRRNAVTKREDYEKLFEHAGVAAAVGEASPIYLIHPAAPDRIRAALPDVRLIAILRHPVERAHAAWFALRRDGDEDSPTIEEALTVEDSRLREGWTTSAGLVRNGLYFQMLSRYYDRFPRERIRVYLYDDLVRDARGLLSDLFEFLGVDPAFVPDLAQRYGATGIIRNPLVRVLWRNSRVPRRLSRTLLPRAWRDAGYAWVTRDLVKPPLAPATRALLMERFRPDIVALQTLIGRDLSTWLEPT
jgi:sulfotransferase family protein